MATISLRSLSMVALLSAALLQGCGTVPVTPQEKPAGAPHESTTPTPIQTETGELPTQKAPQPSAEAADQQRITVAAVGDIMLGRNYPEEDLPPDDGKEMLEAVSPILHSADIAIGNLEGVLNDGGQPFKKCQESGSCFLFRTPSRFVHRLAEAGFDVVSLANNHARDFGEEGRSATMANLDSMGIRHSGRIGDVASWTVAGRRVAFIAFATSAGSYDLRDIPEMQRLVSGLSAKNDVVIVMFHGGAEGSEMIHVPFSTEIFHGEDRGDVARFARAAVDAGADLVIGSGPHVPRGMELRNDHLIVYSLGNFATYQGINVSGRNGLAPILSVTLDGEGRFVSGHIYSNRQERPAGPQPDPSFSAAKLMAKVTAEDFTEPRLKISEDGSIEKIDGLAAAVAAPAGKMAPARVE